MAERVLIHDAGDSGSALALLRQRLKENRIISITVGGNAKRFVPVDFLNFELRLGTGPLHLAVNSSVKCNAAIEADIDVLAKLCEEGFERGSELEAFAGCEVEGHGDLLDVVVAGGTATTIPSDRTEPLVETVGPEIHRSDGPEAHHALQSNWTARWGPTKKLKTNSDGRILERFESHTLTTNTSRNEKCLSLPDRCEQ